MSATETSAPLLPRPRDGSAVVCVAVGGVAVTWLGPAPGVPGTGEIAGDGSRTSREIVAEVRRLWEDPIPVDHPSFAQPVWTVPGDPRGVIAALLHLGLGRGVVIQAPKDALRDVFGDEEDPLLEPASGDSDEEEI